MAFTLKSKGKSRFRKATAKQARERLLVLAGFSAAALLAAPSLMDDDSAAMLFLFAGFFNLLNVVTLLILPKWRALPKQERRPYVTGSLVIVTILLTVSMFAMEEFIAPYVVVPVAGLIIYRLNRWMAGVPEKMAEETLFV